MGYSVPSVASSGPEAIKEVEDKSPDMVLMDIVLERRNGWNRNRDANTFPVSISGCISLSLF